MGIHMNLDYHEPANGDFVALIEAMVGSPPEDPEISGKEISARLVARAKLNKQMADSLGGPGQAAIDSTIGGPPDVGDALETIARKGVSSLVAAFAGILVLAGITMLALTILMPELLPMLQPQHGVGSLFAGLVLRNIAS